MNYGKSVSIRISQPVHLLPLLAPRIDCPNRSQEHIERVNYRLLQRIRMHLSRDICLLNRLIRDKMLLSNSEDSPGRRLRATEGTLLRGITAILVNVEPQLSSKPLGPLQTDREEDVTEQTEDAVLGHLPLWARRLGDLVTDGLGVIQELNLGVSGLGRRHLQAIKTRHHDVHKMLAAAIAKLRDELLGVLKQTGLE